jgi:hypothetical protein
MPNYHNYSYSGFGKITVTPYPWWRKLPIVKLWPYFVGEQVRFYLHVEQPNAPFDIYEQFGSEPAFSIQGLGNSRVEGHVIRHEGDVSYFIGLRQGGPKELHEGMVLFDAKVKSKDDFVPYMFGAIFGAILACMGSCVVGIILYLVGVGK